MLNEPLALSYVSSYETVALPLVLVDEEGAARAKVAAERRTESVEKGRTEQLQGRRWRQKRR